MLVTEEEAKKYPWLVPLEGWYGPDEIPEMWKPAVLQLCEELSKYFDEHPEIDKNKYYLQQGKEKFASACWYDFYGDGEWPNNSYEEIHKIVKKYTDKMNKTCIHCGCSNGKIRTKHDWMYLLCDDCWNNIYKNFKG